MMLNTVSNLSCESGYYYDTNAEACKVLPCDALLLYPYNQLRYEPLTINVQSDIIFFDSQSTLFQSIPTPLNQKFTLTGWIYVSNFTQISPANVIRLSSDDRNDYSNAYNRIMAIYTKNDKKIYFRFADQINNNNECNPPSGQVHDENHWYFFAMSVDYSTGKYKCFIYEQNGATPKWKNQVPNTQANKGIGLVSGQYANISIGGSKFYQHMLGQLKDVRLFTNIDLCENDLAILAGYCVPNCKICSTTQANTCQVCALNFYLKADGTCDSSCDSGFYGEDAAVPNIQQNGGSCQEQDVAHCEDYVPNENSCSNCDDLTEVSNGKCKALNCESYSIDGLTCESCQDGISGVNEGLGYYLNTIDNDGICLLQTVVDNCLTYASNIDACDTCQTNYVYNSDENVCECSVSYCKQCSSTVQCINCQIGYYVKNNNQCVSSCGDSYYATEPVTPNIAEIGGLCTPCSTSGCQTCPNNVCTYCLKNYFLQFNKQCLESCEDKNTYGNLNDRKCYACNYSWKSTNAAVPKAWCSANCFVPGTQILAPGCSTSSGIFQVCHCKCTTLANTVLGKQAAPWSKCQ